MRDNYDVIVVGAGPAGASAAYHAALRGSRTLLVDRKTFPRSKTCGDGLTPRAVGMLVKMQLDHLCDRHVRIHGGRLVAGDTTEASFVAAGGMPPFGLVIPRTVLDAEVATAAVRAGATFIQDAQVQSVLRDRNDVVTGVVVNHRGVLSRVRASATIIADGATGRLSRLVGPCTTPRKMGWAARLYVTNVRGLEPVFEVHMPLTFLGNAVPGYAWIFPVTMTEANVGVGVFDHTTPEASVAAMLAGFIARLKRRDRRFAAAQQTGRIEGGAVSIRMLDPRRVPDGALLVGDAAGLVNPYTGEGIAAALECGEIAAEAVARLGGTERARAWYARALRVRFRRNWALRDAPRHVEWLYEGAAAISRARTPVAAALRAVALDEPQALSPNRDTSGELSGTDFVERFRAAAALRLAARVRRSDRVLAEVAAELLCDPASPAIDPLAIGAAIAWRSRKAGQFLDDKILALVTFVVAQDLIRHVTGDSGGHAGDAAAIIVGDCLLSEAVSMLTSLHRNSVHAISRATSTSAVAHRTKLTACRSVHALRERYAALAAPTACAADLASRRASETARRARRTFAEWYSVTRYAARDLALAPEPSAFRSMLQAVALEAPRAMPDGAVFIHLADRVCATARYAAHAGADGAASSFIRA